VYANKQETHYCYDEAEERQAAVKKTGQQAGDQPDSRGWARSRRMSFAQFNRARICGKQPVMVVQDTHIQQTLEYYMGKEYAGERQNFYHRAFKSRSGPGAGRKKRKL